MKDFNVAIISSLAGGLGHYVAHLAKPLSKLCGTVSYITYPQIDLSGTVVAEVTDPIVKKYIKSPRFDIIEEDPASIIKISDFLDEKNINIINIHVATTIKKKILYFTTFIDYLRIVKGKKVILTLHDVLPFDEDNRLISLLMYFYSNADHLTVGNKFEEEKLVKHFNIPKGKISIVPHGIYDLFDKKKFTQTTAREYLDLPEDKKVILFFGFLREYKGFDYLIKAIDILKNKRSDFIVYVSSGTKYAPKDLAKKYKNEIREKKLEQYFKMSLKYIDTREIEAVFKASDFSVLPYTHASQSGVAMLSLGFKRPVIITDIFEAKSWVNNRAGLITKAKSPEDLARKIEILLNDKKLLEKLGNAGNRYATRNFPWEKIASKYYKIYQSII